MQTPAPKQKPGEERHCQTPSYPSRSVSGLKHVRLAHGAGLGHDLWLRRPETFVARPCAADSPRRPEIFVAGPWGMPVAFAVGFAEKARNPCGRLMEKARDFWLVR